MAHIYHLTEYPGTGEFPFTMGPATVEGAFHEHAHDFVELVVILRGSGRHVINGRTYDCGAGDVYVFSPGSTHAFEKARGLTMVNIMFTPEAILIADSGLRRMPGYQALFGLSNAIGDRFRCMMNVSGDRLPRVRRLLEELAVEYESRRPGYRSLIRATMTGLVVLMCRLYGEDSAAAVVSRPRRIMAEVAGYIEGRLDEEITVEKLMRLSGMSRRHLFRMFNRNFGMPPVRYIMEKRLDHAAGLLASTGMSVTQVGFSSGFSDSNYFARQFKRKYHVPPKEFRIRRRVISDY